MVFIPQFDARKAHYLRELASAVPDRSRKGFADYPILPVLDFVNQLPDYFTTSSCSGRVAVYKERSIPTSQEESVPDDDTIAKLSAPSLTTSSTSKPTTTSQYIPPAAHKADVGQEKRKGGGWLFVSHDEVVIPKSDESLVRMYLPEDMYSTYPVPFTGMNSACKYTSEDENSLPLLVYFKMEPVILHIEARTIEAARDLLNVALSCGFKSSGIVTTHKRHIIHIRGSLKIDSPIATVNDGLLVTPAYLRILTVAANQKMRLNINSINRLLTALENAGLDKTPIPGTGTETKEERRLRKLAAGLAIQGDVQKKKQDKKAAKAAMLQSETHTKQS
eukprot:CFRG7929T1